MQVRGGGGAGEVRGGGEAREVRGGARGGGIPRIDVVTSTVDDTVGEGEGRGTRDHTHRPGGGGSEVLNEIHLFTRSTIPRYSPRLVWSLWFSGFGTPPQPLPPDLR